MQPMMTCTFCSTEQAEDSTACWVCGARAIKAPADAPPGNGPRARQTDPSPQALPPATEGGGMAAAGHVAKLIVRLLLCAAGLAALLYALSKLSASFRG